MLLPNRVTTQRREFCTSGFGARAPKPLPGKELDLDLDPGVPVGANKIANFARRLTRECRLLKVGHALGRAKSTEFKLIVLHSWRASARRVAPSAFSRRATRALSGGEPIATSPQQSIQLSKSGRRAPIRGSTVRMIIYDQGAISSTIFGHRSRLDAGGALGLES